MMMMIALEGLTILKRNNPKYSSKFTACIINPVECIFVLNETEEFISNKLFKGAIRVSTDKNFNKKYPMTCQDYIYIQHFSVFIYFYILNLRKNGCQLTVCTKESFYCHYNQLYSKFWSITWCSQLLKLV